MNFKNVIDMFSNETLKMLKQGQIKKETFEDFYSFELDVPGFSKQNLQVLFDNFHKKIFIQGSKEKLGKEKTINHFISLTEDCDCEKISVKLENGLLEILIPKKQIEDKKILIIQ